VPGLAIGALVLVVVLLSLSGKDGAGKKNANALIGGLAVAAFVLVLLRAGQVWLAPGVVLLWYAVERWKGKSVRGNPQAPPPARRGSPRMSMEEAYQVLGLEQGASEERVLAEYRRLMKKVHPDQGGTTYLASRLNEAKDVLLAARR